MEAFPPRPFSLPLEDERLELELPDLEELLLELPLELLLDEEEEPDLLREREELDKYQGKFLRSCIHLLFSCNSVHLIGLPLHNSIHVSVAKI